MLRGNEINDNEPLALERADRQVAVLRLDSAYIARSVRSYSLILEKHNNQS